MRRQALGRLAIALLAAALTAAAAAAGQSARMTFGSLTIEGQSWQGGLRGQGPWEWKGPVTVRASGLTMTCDKVFKLWPTPDYRDFERVEASGHIRIDGRYRAADETEWEITGRADAGTYDAKTRQGVLSGSVTFRARNSVTGAVVSAEAERFIYDTKTQLFRFERGDKIVRADIEWPKPEAKPGTGSQSEPEAEKAGGG